MAKLKPMQYRQQQLSLPSSLARFLAAALVLFLGMGHALRDLQTGSIDFSAFHFVLAAQHHLHVQSSCPQHNTSGHSDHTSNGHSQHCPLCGAPALADATLSSLQLVRHEGLGQLPLLKKSVFVSRILFAFSLARGPPVA